MNLSQLVNAHVTSAIVSIARQEFDAALAIVDEGIAGESQATGLHWLRGLLLLRAGRVTRAILAFARELDELPEDDASALRVEAQVGAGFAHLAAQDPAGAIDAFRLALQTLPRHGRALIGLQSAFRQTSFAAEAAQLTVQIDDAIVDLSADVPADVPPLIAAAQLIQGAADRACATLEQFLEDPSPAPAAWLIPLDPALAGLRTHPRYPHLMSLLAARAR